MGTLFSGIFDSELVSVISFSDFMLCMMCALVVGLILAGMYMYKNRYTKSFVATLALLPAIVCAVIMMVNGNVGTGVAVAGAFSLVRFRSVPGSAREIGALFLAMGSGMIAGMGYLAYAVLFAVLLGGMSLIYNRIDFGERKNAAKYKTLHVTIPEDLDYTGVFDEIFADYAEKWELVNVKTTNMGSLYKLTYQLTMQNTDKEKEIVKRGRNAENHHIAKNATVQEYMYSTAFEALIGYLYLTKQEKRLKEILEMVIDINKKHTQQ